METLGAWWNGLGTVNQWFYGVAFFFGAIFLWQMIMSFIGLEHDVGLDTQVEPDSVHDTPDDATQTLAAFKLISIRSILAFLTLFSWGGALYLNQGLPMGRALGYSILWGLAAMLAVSFIFSLMGRMTESGNIKIGSCLGVNTTVYLDIPAGGVGEIRVPCSGVMTHIKARSAKGDAIKAGTPVKVVRLVESNTVEVETVEAG
ncbi:MAG: hypothetical protein GX608_04135 [Lentisphaerae bacterium]|nr:hypothetical protein [Lentisphaerota bacterium]